MSIGERRPGVAGGDDDAARLDAGLPDIDWSVAPVGAVFSRFAAPSGELSVVSLGDPADPRVVLIPGVTGSKEDFYLLAPILVAAGYHVESFDIAGQYESADAGPVPGGHYTYELLVTDIVAFLQSGPPAHVLGYSFAGVLAQLALVEHPHLFRSLTLLTTPPEPGQAFRGVRVIGWLSWFLNGRQGAGLMIWGIVTNKNKVPPSRLAFVRSRFSLTRRSSVDDIVGLMKRVPDVRGRVAALRIPLLVATGNHDLWPTHLHAANAQALGATLAVYSTGHSPCETAPHQLARDMVALFHRAERAEDARRD
ncbi:alpha/beta hydrolase [Leifsonia sp. Root227]|uniref:alpha/beta fold hydrolase n=1 Tax=unclassified Leifsonia TaxID=2663824 RepID=UPI0006FE9175|nr:alpha/beta fold hydrolase [Leifsonia sp. Root227]KRC50607.1 alpha/beta hydrolase [Leifsonia sp. Root227]